MNKPSAVEAALGNLEASFSDEERAAAAARVAAKWGTPKPHKTVLPPSSRVPWEWLIVAVVVLGIGMFFALPKILQVLQ